MESEKIKDQVRKGYADIAQEKSSCCSPIKSCCGDPTTAVGISKKIGYSDTDIKAVPDGANMGLGCGNPIAIASLKEGETVLDLGSGGGFDCFLAAKQVGKTGKVIGVDMTPEMIANARANAQKGNYTNVDFRLGEIEELPVEDNTVDIAISNCVINLVPDKSKAFSSIFRTLKPGGRMMVSDIVLLKELPSSIKQSVSAYVGCLAGALLKNNYLEAIKLAGFKDLKIVSETPFALDLMTIDPTAKEFTNTFNILPEELKKAADSVISINVSAYKPYT